MTQQTKSFIKEWIQPIATLCIGIALFVNIQVKGEQNTQAILELKSSQENQAEKEENYRNKIQTKIDIELRVIDESLKNLEIRTTLLEYQVKQINK